MSKHQSCREHKKLRYFHRFSSSSLFIFFDGLLASRASGQLMDDELQIHDVDEPVAIEVGARVVSGLACFLSKRRSDGGHVGATHGAITIDVSWSSPDHERHSGDVAADAICADTVNHQRV